VNPILPGGTIGILGGGQLGRMTAMAARAMGYRVQVMDPDPSCPARFVVDACFQGGWDDALTAAYLARGSDVVTLEIEQISLDCLEAAAKYAPVRPGVAAMRIIQDRILQKNWLHDHGFPVGPYRAVTTEAELQAAVPALGGTCFVKGARGGYDGRGQAKLGFDDLATEEKIHDAWIALGQAPCVAEQALDLDREISVMTARSATGEVCSFPSARNHHEQQILAWSVIPSAVPVEMETHAQRIASEISAALGLEGLLAVEMFVSKRGELLVNELAPRPHNSYHASERACVTNQFEQAVRAVCGLPLGDPSVMEPAAIVNLLGDVWLSRQPDFVAALSVPGVRLHLYEKQEPRKGRKMGHLSAVGTTPEQAVERVLAASSKL
jgi:5-(carboxyamino)imidazole ribonucleotide synthase